jgi:hypothetical protein
MLPQIPFLGPIVQLRYRGLLCPCLSADPDDEMARAALGRCTDLRIRYHRRTSPSDQGGQSGGEGGGGGNALAAAVSSVSGLFGGSKGGGGGKGGSGGGGGDHQGESSSSGSYVKGPATLTVIDTPRGPALHVETEPDPSMESTEVDEAGNVIQLDTRHRKTVPLRKITKIKSVDGNFLGMAVGGAGPSLVSIVGAGPARVGGSQMELLRFNVLDAKGQKAESAEVREEVMDALRGLVEWDKRRQRAAGETDHDNDGDRTQDGNDGEDGFDNDDDDPHARRPGAPRGRAAKAAYFARREFELSQQRKEREKRKARYLEGGGGLKYTAIAMANRAEMT